MTRNKGLKLTGLILFFSFMITLSGCYSVFSGGTGGLVVDAESTSNPKAGIANVDVYAYVSEGDRDSDFDNWVEGTGFTPTGYYGHTTTGNDGSFTISKLVWKETKPDFGRDADYTDVYLIFFHENYGITKGQTVIISDSSTDTVYAELKAVRKSTVLNLNFIDVATGNNTGNTVYVKVAVPQATSTMPNAAAKVYDGVITGTGEITVTYPRWTTPEDKTAGKENTPAVLISYVQSGDEITWKGCYNADNEAKNYAFRTDAETGISKVISNPSYSLTFYGKSSRLNVPSVNGQYTANPAAPSSADDGITISLKQKDSANAYTIDLGQATTYAQTIGTSGTEKHGVFSGLGNGYTWTDNSYTGKYSTIDVEVSGGGKSKQCTLRSDSANYTVQLQ